jgi:hypothetical protein
MESKLTRGTNPLPSGLQHPYLSRAIMPNPWGDAVHKHAPGSHGGLD